MVNAVFNLILWLGFSDFNMGVAVLMPGEKEKVFSSEIFGSFSLFIRGYVNWI